MPLRMSDSPERPGIGHRSRLTAAFVTAVVALSLTAVGLVGPAAAAPHTPPPNPSDAQLSRAAAQKAQAAKDVGRLSGLVAGIDAQVVHLNGLAELAQEKYLQALSELAQARTAAVAARARVAAAQRTVDTARVTFRLYIAAAYMNRGQDTSVLLTAKDPSALLAQADLSAYTAARQLTGIGDLSRATVTKSNADATARVALARQATLATAAATAQRAAVQAVAEAKVEQARLAAQKASYERQLQAAGEALTGLQNKRAAYRAWVVAEAKRQAAERARKARLLRLELAAQAREQARADRAASAPSGGSGGGYTGGNVGVWTPAKGRAAADRALHWLGEPYSFAAGSFTGPTWGACVTDDSGWNDCHVFGFDCSGLALYAWAGEGIYMDHFAMTQYGYGSVHPSVDELLPGDLVFWSSNGARSGIHHVAIYIGGGNVVQAPQSGDVVKISPLWSDEYFGATRPGT